MDDKALAAELAAAEKERAEAISLFHEERRNVARAEKRNGEREKALTEIATLIDAWFVKSGQGEVFYREALRTVGEIARAALAAAGSGQGHVPPNESLEAYDDAMLDDAAGAGEETT